MTAVALEARTSTDELERRLEAALAEIRARDERDRLIAQVANDALWEHDHRTGKICWTSRAVTGIVADDSRPTDWTYDLWLERIHPDDRPGVLETTERALAARQALIEQEYRFRRADGGYADLFSRSYVQYEDGAPVRSIGAISDRSVRRKAEARLHQVQNELIHVSRLTAMGTMASTLAHELNQPLAAIANYLHAARKLVVRGDAAQLPDLLFDAEQSALRAGQIIRRLRELVARGRIERRPTQVRALLNEVAGIALLDAGELGVVHRIEVAADTPPAIVDPVQIQQVLINLVRNAVEAMRESSVRALRLSAGPAEEGMIAVAVDDSGPGVHPTLRETVFSPFATTKEEGMGIGLSISRTIVEAHGGAIRLEDSELGGARFRLTLPAAE